MPPAILTLADFGPTIAFDENTVNASPQLLDADITFTDSPTTYDGGKLTLTGILAEDVVSVNNQGTDAGQIGLSGTDVTYAGTVIGTLAGGNGSDLSISLTIDATAAAIDALIQNLTYANTSDAPTASREFLINVTDVDGTGITATNEIRFQELAGAENPLGYITTSLYPAAAFIDLDDDGLLDLLIAQSAETPDVYFQLPNGLGFAETASPAHPFSGINFDYFGSPTAVDIDGDGDLDLVVGGNFSLRVFQNNDADTTFTELFGAENPLSSIPSEYNVTPAFADIDGDGDLDMAMGNAYGQIRVFAKNDLVDGYSELFGSDNPFSAVYVGPAMGRSISPAFADLDGDGDLDLVYGDYAGGLHVYENNDADNGFTALLGADNPFDGVDINGTKSASAIPAFVDLDGDGDLDAVVGETYGSFVVFENQSVTSGQIITLNITPENDPLTAANLPTDATVKEDISSNLDLSAITLSDPDLTDTLTVVLTASSGTLVSFDGIDVTVSGSGTDTLSLTGTASAIDGFLNDPALIKYTGAANVFGDNAATVTVTADDGSGAVPLGTVNIDILSVNDAPVLTGLARSVTFAENTVNVTPQLLDFAVSFSDVEGKFEGGSLRLTGLLAEDLVSVQNQGTGAGQIGLTAAPENLVSYEGVVIGNLQGGIGNDLVISFNADASPVAINALIQNLTYANTSDAPTASRDFSLNVIDSDGADLGLGFAPLLGADNPFDGVVFQTNAAPAFFDLNADGLLDALVGGTDGTLDAYINNAGVFSGPDNTLNPFAGIDFGFNSAPVFADYDGDSDLDLVVATTDNGILLYRNDAGIFTDTTIANPFAEAPVIRDTTVAFADLDGDDDLDLVVGNGTNSGGIATLRTYYNDGGTFTEALGTANPFNGISYPKFVSPSFGDLDGDGDLDLLVGDYYGALHAFENLDGVFVEMTGANNPFDGIDVGTIAHPSFVDLDQDGDLDLAVGSFFNKINTFENTGPNRGNLITVNVALENDAPSAIGFPTDLTFLEGTTSNVDLTGVTLDDPDLTDTMTLMLIVSSGTLTFASYVGAPAIRELGGIYFATGDLNALRGLLATPSNIQYTSAPSVYGDNAATLQLSFDDAMLATFAITVNLDIVEKINPIYGTFTDDVLIGTDGADLILGLTGNDTLRGSARADSLDGGTGIDTADYRTSGLGVSVNLETNINTRGDAQGDTLLHIENIFGSAHSDRLIGDAGDNLLVGMDGADRLVGGDGNDILRGGAGADVMYGGLGQDTADYRSSSAGVTVNLTTGINARAEAAGDILTNIENIAGSDFADLLSGDANTNIIFGGNGNDTISGGAGADVLSGGDGYDFADYRTSATGVSVNLLDGSNTGGDALGDRFISIEGLIGSARDDILAGDNGDNIIFGLGGADTIFGGDGNDIIRGGRGADFLDGGAGIDWLDYSGSSAGVIVAFESDYSPVVSTALGDATGDTAIGFENIRGTQFADLLIGNAGRNALFGAGGTDFFGFFAALGNGNVDRILDFTYGEDTLLLGIESFVGLRDTPAFERYLNLDVLEFVANTSGLAETAEHRIIYETDTGRLSYDADGTGSGRATVFAVLDINIDLGVEHFLLL